MINMASLDVIIAAAAFVHDVGPDPQPIHQIDAESRD